MAKPGPVCNQQTSMLTFSCNELCTFNCLLLTNISVQKFNLCDNGIYVTPALQSNTDYMFLVTATDQVGKINGESSAYS